MKILMPVLHYHPVIGGFEIFIKTVCEKLSKTDDIFVVTGKVASCPRKEKKQGLRIYRNASLYELKDYSYSSYIYILTMIPFLFLYSWFLIKKEKIEVLHAQGFFSGVICLLLKKVTGVPYVLTIQSADFTIYHSEIKFNAVVHWQSALEKKVYKEAKICHAVSFDLQKHFANQGRSDAAMIPNGVETDIFTPIDSEKKEQVRKKLHVTTRYFVSCLSRLQEKNGTHTLVEAMAVLAKKRKDISCYIIGDGVERQRIEQLIKEHSLEDSVFLVGHILHNEVGEYIAASDVFVRPSLAEGFGIVYIEAMACDVPIIATPVGGIVDFLKDEETGLFCEVENPQDLADKIEKLVDNKELAKKIVINSRNMIEKQYSWDSITKEVGTLYEKAVK